LPKFVKVTAIILWVTFFLDMYYKSAIPPRTVFLWFSRNCAHMICVPICKKPMEHFFKLLHFVLVSSLQQASVVLLL